jgi:tRNA (mo5U34)-methyltransferase
MASTRQSIGERVAELGAAEREVADLLPIEAEPDAAHAALERVPFWFHTFALNRREGIYAPGAARDHRYRIPAIPEDFGGAAVLDVGSFDGFYAFLAEHRGAGRVVAVDNEQYRDWVWSRWGIELAGGEGIAAIRDLLGSNVEYRRLDAFDLEQLDERFDIALCFGILHRVEDPAALLEVLREQILPRGLVLVETYGVRGDDGEVVEHRPGDVYEGDAYVYWGFSARGLDRLARSAGFAGFEPVCAPIIDGHPRILGEVRA